MEKKRKRKELWTTKNETARTHKWQRNWKGTEKKIRKNEILEMENFERLIDKLKSGKITIDNKTCSIYFNKILQKKFKILNKEDPIYLSKSIKNKNEIKNSLKLVQKNQL